MAFTLERLHESHDVRAFTCGSRPGAGDIDRYLHEHALAEQNAGLATVWLALDDSAPTVPGILGYFSLSPTSVRLSPALQDLLPLRVSYAQVGGYLLGRLGVAVPYQGSDWGGTLVAAAIAKANQLREDGGGAFLAVDPKNDRLAQWYDGLGFGFVALDTTGQTRRRVLKLR
jgi:ribosomal protein S18 acetylase RimI-like enzyme